MFNFDINKPPKRKYSYLVYCTEQVGDRCANGIFYKSLDIARKIKIDDFGLHLAETESDADLIARIIKAFETKAQAQEYINKMKNLSKCDWEKYLETLTQDRKSFLVENNKKIRLYPNGSEIIL